MLHTFVSSAYAANWTKRALYPSMSTPGDTPLMCEVVSVKTTPAGKYDITYRKPGGETFARTLSPTNYVFFADDPREAHQW